MQLLLMLFLVQLLFFERSVFLRRSAMLHTAPLVVWPVFQCCHSDSTLPAILLPAKSVCPTTRPLMLRCVFSAVYNQGLFFPAIVASVPGQYSLYFSAYLLQLLSLSALPAMIVIFLRVG